MHSSVDRRRFLKTISAAALSSARAAAEEKPVRVGILGSGGRGTGLLGILLSLKNVLVPAICDISENNLGHAQNLVEQAGQPRPEGYSRGEHDFERLLQRNDLDAVLIASPWEWHTPMAVAAMLAGKYAAVEVPCALTYDQCWQLVNTHERTKVPCMMLENWSFRRDNLAVLNMVRAGLFGQMVHCHCAHSHDCIDHWFWDKDGNARWPARYLIERNADQYPTHALGPVLRLAGYQLRRRLRAPHLHRHRFARHQRLLCAHLRPQPSQRQTALRPGRYCHQHRAHPQRPLHRH